MKKMILWLRLWCNFLELRSPWAECRRPQRMGSVRKNFLDTFDLGYCRSEKIWPAERIILKKWRLIIVLPFMKKEQYGNSIFLVCFIFGPFLTGSDKIFFGSKKFQYFLSFWKIRPGVKGDKTEGACYHCRIFS